VIVRYFPGRVVTVELRSQVGRVRSASGHAHGGRQHQRGGGADGVWRPRSARGCGQGGGVVLAREPTMYKGSTRLPVLVLGHADED
jgi:hypothetical protein